MEDSKIRDLMIRLGADFHSFSVIDLRKLAENSPTEGRRFSEPPPDEFPDYLKRTWTKRSSPANFAPWARTCIVFAMPFEALPDNRNLLPQTDDGRYCGLVSGYAGRKLDYHPHLRELAAKFADSMRRELGMDFRSEVCVDTRPVAEKNLALAAGLGTAGFNTCILVPGAGSTAFFGELFISERLPEFKFEKCARQSFRCAECSKCFKNCPTGALGAPPGRFRYTLCRCFLTMEKKGEFTEDEKRLLGKWVFGCDLCVGDCPGSNPVSPLKVDLKWLSSAPEAEIESLINGTAMEYAGAARLRRNALAAIQNK